MEGGPEHIRPLEIQEQEEAQRRLWKIAQRESFLTEIVALQKKGSFPSTARWLARDPGSTRMDYLGRTPDYV